MRISSIQKWFLIAALWALILILVFAFYWNRVRPVNIRKMCAERARKLSTQFKSGTLSDIFELNQALYADCLRRHGIEK